MPASWLHHTIQTVSPSAGQLARKRLSQFPYPPGALGTLAEIAERMAAMQNRPDPVADPVQLTLFAADHGVTKLKNSTTDATTQSWLNNCLHGKSASAIMARSLGIHYEVVDVGLTHDPGPLPGLLSHRAGNGTTDFRRTPAMSMTQLNIALTAGLQAIERAEQAGVKIFIGGEIGSGKTTSAGALACALMGMPPETVAGPGSDNSVEMMAVKASIIQNAVDHHQRFTSTPIEALRRLGGFEIAALCGAYIACGQRGITIIVDGFCASIAALIAISIHPQLKQWIFFGHRAAEPGQYNIFRTLDMRPLLNLDMRLGEGTGAAIALPLLRTACALLSETTQP